MTEDYQLEREMPASVEAERSVLGAILLDSLSCTEALGAKLEADHFSLDSHRRIYSALRSLAEAGSATDLITLSEELSRRKHLPAVGGVAYLSSLTDGVPRRPSIDQHIRLVKDKALLRGIVHLAQSMTAAALEQCDSGADLLTVMETRLAELRSRGLTISARHVSEIIVDAMNRWTQMREVPEGEVIGLHTGIPQLDEMTTGIRPYEYWVVGARPNVGKTPLLAQIALANARRGVKVGIFSEEMSDVQLMFRCVAHAGIVPSFHVRDPRNLSDAQFRMARGQALEQIGALPLWVWKGQRTIADLQAEAQMAIYQHGLELLIVDYLQQTEAPGRNGFERVTNVSRGLDKLIDKTGVPVVTASQLNRDAKDPKRRPQLGDLRESGQIEQDADVVLLIHREPDEHDEPTEVAELLIAKQREGAKGHVPVRFDDRTLTFQPREEKQPAAEQAHFSQDQERYQ